MLLLDVLQAGTRPLDAVDRMRSLPRSCGPQGGAVAEASLPGAEHSQISNIQVQATRLAIWASSGRPKGKGFQFRHRLRASLSCERRTSRIGRGGQAFCLRLLGLTDQGIVRCPVLVLGVGHA